MILSQYLQHSILLRNVGNHPWIITVISFLSEANPQDRFSLGRSSLTDQWKPGVIIHTFEISLYGTLTSIALPVHGFSFISHFNILLIHLDLAFFFCFMVGGFWIKFLPLWKLVSYKAWLMNQAVFSVACCSISFSFFHFFIYTYLHQWHCFSLHL